jgi:exodeoxyribonuclease VII small subunit
MAEKAAAGRPVAEMSFEDALQELETVVGRLESGDVPLDESIALYARGDLLRRHCDDKLKAAQARVEEITQGPDGTVGAKPSDLD